MVGLFPAYKVFFSSSSHTHRHTHTQERRQNTTGGLHCNESIYIIVTGKCRKKDSLVKLINKN